MTISLLILGSVSSVYANENQQEHIDIKVNYNNIINDDGEIITYGISNFEEIAEFYDLNNPKNITVSFFKNTKKLNLLENSYNNSIGTRGLFSSISIKKVNGPDFGCGTRRIAEVSAVNFKNKTIEKNITLTGTLSNSYSLNVGAEIDVKAVTISSAVGFDVTKSWTNSDSTVVTLKPGESVRVVAYPLYDFYNYDVYRNSWGDSKMIGSGTATECKGFCTVTY